MRIARPRRTKSRIAALAATAALLSGCSGVGQEGQRTEGEEGPGSTMDLTLVEQFEQARASATSDFEREVFDRAIENGEISADDYEEAFSRYRQCAQDAGLEESYERQPDGIYQIQPSPFEDDTASQRYQDLSIECADGTTMRIEALYRTQISNPDLLEDGREVTLQCLVEAGLVPADYTVEQLHEDFQNGFEDAPFDPMDATAQDCLVRGGYNVEIQDESS
ncbi:hypothetical protein [Marinitenerispora sediminis]|uniref:Lipoprotein n=1 Tax=Marinitenerispora sediminis TaxID=1931232 RepID=A0A368T299_9ACTN|nr:hypothetical protein [Marinitenerispora sediminis]RCV55492.1 hypothetical protein DEF24_17815 [Marinitenerispora sediminis]RCV57604.1 hypothetical protein DEF28_01425 [Marinitenerispora sediminis]RCV59649.1 hypothetical protein DEF23_06635 [Marinitenerispora sediminis]